MFVIRNGLRWRDAPKEYGSHKTLYNRFVRWSRLGVFNEIFVSFVVEKVVLDILMIDMIYLKVYRMVVSFFKKGVLIVVLGVIKVV